MPPTSLANNANATEPTPVNATEPPHVISTEPTPVISTEPTPVISTERSDERSLATTRHNNNTTYPKHSHTDRHIAMPENTGIQAKK